MSRTLVKTDKAGWFVDLAESDKKVRRKPDDNVYDTEAEAKAALKVLESIGGSGEISTADKPAKTTGKKATSKGKTAASKNGAKPDRPDPQSTVSETGKILVGKTLEIRCQWKEGGKRCTKTRIIKPQDKFQVKYCVDHQNEHRKAIRRAKQRARTVERRTAREAEAKKGSKA